MEIKKFNPTTRFKDRVEDYIRYRPSYPDELFVKLSKLGLFKNAEKVADIGAGTGIFTEQLKKYTSKICAIEPNSAMFEAGAALVQNDDIHWIKAEAESTSLSNNSIDVVFSAQAFHWFDVPKTVVEWKRILKKNGKVVLLWNNRKTDCDRFHKEYEELLKKHCKRYTELTTRYYSKHQLEDIWTCPINFLQFENWQKADWTFLKGRLNSSSYVPSQGTPEYSNFINKMHQLYLQNEVDDHVTLLYNTDVFIIEMNQNE